MSSSHWPLHLDITSIHLIVATSTQAPLSQAEKNQQTTTTT